MTFTGRTGTVLLAALIVSLCVNLLLAGVMIGGRWHHGGPWWREVPEEARAVMKQTFESHKAEFDARRDAVRQARQKVADILKADPIDQARLDQALSELSQQSQAMRELGNMMMVEMAKQLPPDLRGQMADRWAKDRFRRGGDSH
jgi:Spy/CpxP family protein refolding chaperone